MDILIGAVILVYWLIVIVATTILWENVEINWFYKILIGVFWPVAVILLMFKWRKGGYK